MNKPSTSSRLTPRIVLLAVLGAYFAVITCIGLDLDVGVLSTDMAQTVPLLVPAVVFVALASALCAYALISPAVVRYFTAAAALCYCLRAAISAESYLLAVGLCGIMALVLRLCEIKLPRSKAILGKGGASALLVVICAVAGGWMLFVLAGTHLTYTDSPSLSTGVYAQMLHSMKETLVPLTTLELGEAANHFGVHISPIFYLFLPFYALVPSPVTLMVIQVLAVVSAVIPLYLLARHRGLSRGTSVLLCGLLCLFPAVLCATSTSVHEYALLLPLLLWLLWALETKKSWQVWLFVILCLCTRETAALYVATVGLYWLLTHRDRTLPEHRKARRMGLILAAGGTVYFIAAMVLLSFAGYGTLITRFSNLTGIYHTGFGSLARTLLVNPALALYEMLTQQKLVFVLTLLLPLCLLPVLTRKKAGLVFLIPLLLLNLLSDFGYHYDLNYPYAYGMAAVLFYLAVLSLSERRERDKPSETAHLSLRAKRLLLCAVCMTLIIMAGRLTEQKYLVEYVATGHDEIAAVREVLDTVPDGASVSASGRLLSSLSDRDHLYPLSADVATEYVILDLREEWSLSSEADYTEEYYLEQGYEIVLTRAGAATVLRLAG